MLKLITGPDKEPITLIEAKMHLRVDGDFENALIDGLIQAFRSSVDGVDGTLNRALITQTWELYLDRFPCADRGGIQIPLPPLQSIDSIQYYDTDGHLKTLPEADYFVYSIPEPAELYPAYGRSWPTALNRAGSVIIRFTAGYGDGPESVPAAIRQAGFLQIGHWYVNRESVNVGNTVNEMPEATKHLLGRFKTYMHGDDR